MEQNLGFDKKERFQIFLLVYLLPSHDENCFISRSVSLRSVRGEPRPVVPSKSNWNGGGFSIEACTFRGDEHHYPRVLRQVRRDDYIRQASLMAF